MKKEHGHKIVDKVTIDQLIGGEIASAPETIVDGHIADGEDGDEDDWEDECVHDERHERQLTDLCVLLSVLAPAVVG